MHTGSKVWLITGSSRGLGRAFAQAALDAGHRVIATARNPLQLSDLVSNYGDRVRLTAIAELGGYDTSHRPEDFTTLLRAARELFPGAGDYQRPDFWAGLRPMTPDNLPIFGHGHMGWTWACGSARITADLIAGRKPEHDARSMMLH